MIVLLLKTLRIKERRISHVPRIKLYLSAPVYQRNGRVLRHRTNKSRTAVIFCVVDFAWRTVEINERPPSIRNGNCARERATKWGRPDLLYTTRAFCFMPEERSKRTKGFLNTQKKLHPPEGQEKYCAINVSGGAAHKYARLRRGLPRTAESDLPLLFSFFLLNKRNIFIMSNNTNYNFKRDKQQVSLFHFSFYFFSR